MALAVCAGVLAAGVCASAEAGKGDPPPPPQLGTTLTDFFQPGTQPHNGGIAGGLQPLITSHECMACHANFGTDDPLMMVDIYKSWAGSVMAQSARDPLFHAALAIANQDANDAGEFCIRCHAPVAYLNGRSVPTDASAFEPVDYEGISCNVCHRMVDPVYVEGVSPSEDLAILNALAAEGLIPQERSNSRFIIDPTDTRRGPFNDIALNVHTGDPTPPIIASSFHQHAEFCWNCHDVSNPLLEKQKDGSYGLAALNSPHPTQKQEDMMPLHRTYSEWKNSYYSTIGVLHLNSDGTPRFGGNHPTGIMKTCQDCHLPDMESFGCNLQGKPFFSRPDMPQHGFLGANTWVVSAVRFVDADEDGEPDFPDQVTHLSDEIVNANIIRNIDFLQRASDLHLSINGSELKARVVNRTGHKLPTGFPDGRRVWLNMVFLDCQGQIIEERGAYNFETGQLTASDTKVYETVLGIDGKEYAAQVGHPEGHTFHFMLANKVLKDNRIPPTGYDATQAAANQTLPVGASYINGQHWDDTFFAIPPGTKTIVGNTYYQLASKEFVEFLRDANHTNNRGQIAYDLWVQHGMSPPVLMDSAQLTIIPATDLNADGQTNVDDLVMILGNWGACSGSGICLGDLNGDSVVNVDDLVLLLGAWGPC